MELENNLNESQNSTGKIYNDRAIIIGTFLGGPLVAGYFIAQNYRVFGEPKKAITAFIYSVIITILILATIFIPSLDRLPNLLFPIIYTAIISIAIRLFQGKRIETHIENGGELQSWWKVGGISFLLMIITSVIFIGTALLTMPNEKSKTYGITNNEINYIENNMTVSEVDDFARALKKIGYFDDEEKSFAYIEKSDKTYIISIGLVSRNALDSDILNEFRSLRKDIQKEFPNNKVVFHFVYNGIENVIKRIE